MSSINKRTNKTCFVILDTNFLLIPSQFNVDIFEELSKLLIKRLIPLILSPTYHELLRMNRDLRRYPITPSYLFMMGIPGETMGDLSESVHLSITLVDQNPHAVVQFSIFTPFPRTELFDRAVTHGLNMPKQIEEWIPYNYRNFSENEIWLDKRMRKSIEMIDFCALFLGKKRFLEPYEKRNPWVRLLLPLYAPLARRRMERLFYHCPVEIKMSKRFGIYGKQN